VLEFPGLKINLAESLAFLDGRALDLTQLEFQMLVRLARNPGWPFTSEQLFSLVWGEKTVDTRTVAVHSLFGARGINLIISCKPNASVPLIMLLKKEAFSVVSNLSPCPFDWYPWGERLRRREKKLSRLIYRRTIDGLTLIH